MISLGIVKQAKANTLTVVDNAHAELEKIKRNLPEGTTIEDSYDSSVFIKDRLMRCIVPCNFNGTRCISYLLIPWQYSRNQCRL